MKHFQSFRHQTLSVQACVTNEPSATRSAAIKQLQPALSPQSFLSNYVFPWSIGSNLWGPQGSNGQRTLALRTKAGKICFCFQNISSTYFLSQRKHLPDKASDVIPVALLPTGRRMIIKVVRTQKPQHIKLREDSAANQCKWSCKEKMDILEWVQQKSRHD